MLHTVNRGKYVGAPVFARADGGVQREARIVVGGEEDAMDIIMPLLEAMAKGIYRFGDDPGDGNVVKLCGIFIIGAAIEGCAEA